MGCAIAVVATFALLLLDETSSVVQVAATCFGIGLGMGLIASPTLIAAQSTVEWSERGVVTGNNLFCRSLGSALGVAVFGAIANATLASSDQGSGSTGGNSRTALATATHHVFLAIAVLTVLMTIAVLGMARDRPVPP